MSAPMFGLLLVSVGLVAIFLFARRAPRRVKSPGGPHGLLVEASVPVESDDDKRSLFPVREVSLHTVPCDGSVVKGSPIPSRVAVLHHEFVSWHQSLGAEFVDDWDGDESDWCPPRGVARPVGLVR